MKIMIKRTLVAIALTSALTSTGFAATISSSPLVDSKIQGYRPYMAAIGSNIVTGGKADPSKPGYILPQVGAIIEIPSYAESNLFRFVDKDGDLVAKLGSQFTLPNGNTVTGKEEFLVDWFVIEPKDGFKFPDQIGDEQNVASWDDLVAVKIETDFVAGNKNSHSLIVPESASGKRLGFIATPTSENGYPNKGTPVKAWDLSKIWTQKEVVDPGECLIGSTDPSCTEEGKPDGGDNPTGGGGSISAPEGFINIFNARTNTVVKSGDPLTVDTTYYAVIRIKSSDGVSYRDPTEEELNTIKWNIVDPTDSETIIASYTVEDTESVNNDSDLVGPGGAKVYEFRTQKINADAKDPLQITPPNYSEQGWGLKVTIETE
ncbi:hypothetical protein [Thorsellia kenyensis]|uniref:Cell surface protein n=1 Tax=Thorsellia kenyensis TaxID=1549888 RepID=A0ABV6C700_9GAMM